jgi:hypothetical protein
MTYNCNVCGKQNIKVYWARRYSELKFCKECFEARIGLAEQQDQAIRLSIAVMLKRIRRESGREAAIRAYDRLRGTGVPINIFRRSRGVKHFHILWSSNKFDYAAHATEYAANAAARTLAYPKESWVIVEVDGECKPSCLAWLAQQKIIKKPGST